MLRVLHEEKVETEYPTGVINWTKYEAFRRPTNLLLRSCSSEEGARFPISMVYNTVGSKLQY
jgi:hypothetical protein